MRSRLEQVKNRGVKCSSLCSGIDAAGEACRLIQLAVAEAEQTQASAAWILPMSFCDHGKHQKAFLQARANALPHSPCVFGALQDRVPAEVKAECGIGSFKSESKTKGGGKRKGGGKADRAEVMAFFEKAASWMKVHGDQAFPATASSWCYQHEDNCRVRQSRDMPSRPTSHDLQEGPDSHDALLMSIGGLACVAWSKVGLRLGSADVLSEEAYQVWLAERRQWALERVEDMFLFENVPQFPVNEKLREPLKDTHDVIALNISPQDWG